MPGKPINDAMKRLANAEAAFLEAEFLAPVVRGRGVGVQIAGVRCRLTVEPVEFRGWGVFKPLSHTAAKMIRPATATERRRYLSLFPKIQLVICGRGRDGADAVAANPSDGRFQMSGAVEVQLPNPHDLFDTIHARFDGTQFWFEDIDSRSDPAIAAYLRRTLSDLLQPIILDRPGMNEGQRMAYAIAYTRRIESLEADENTRGERRLKSALAHAGADLRDFTDAGDSYRVTYEIDGQRHTSIVRKNDLTVQSAGICLSGEDQKFDLNSLVGVLREGQ